MPEEDLPTSRIWNWVGITVVVLGLGYFVAHLLWGPDTYREYFQDTGKVSLEAIRSKSYGGAFKPIGIGAVRRWHENGILRFEGNAGDTAFEGQQTWWSENGTKIDAWRLSLLGSNMNFNASQPMVVEGEWVNCPCRTLANLPADWDLADKGIASFRSSAPADGTRLAFYPSGKKKIQITYVSGFVEGEFYYWGEDGAVLATANYHLGEPAEDLLIAYPGGARCVRARFIAGGIVGSFKEWSRSGSLVREVIQSDYLNGKEGGPVIRAFAGPTPHELAYALLGRGFNDTLAHRPLDEYFMYLQLWNSATNDRDKGKAIDLIAKDLGEKKFSLPKYRRHAVL